MSEAVFRLFVSSPGDVAAERARAEAVIEKLNTEFKDRARFDAEFWEDHFYSAHETFQKQIPEAADFDLVVAIFRARLGSPLPEGFQTLPGGEPYPSGTAYEVLSAIAKRRDGAPLPDIYVFRYPRAPQVSLDAADFAEIDKQWRALMGFFERWFETPSGQFVAGFQAYDNTDDFAERVEGCLRQWLAKRGIAARETWDRARLGSPFPGLAAFEADRERVFFGREISIRQAIERLRAAKAPFLLILGASGAGKSSLLRAGLLPKLTRPGAVPEIDLLRPALMTPGLDPFGELAGALLAPEALGPELSGGRFADKATLAQALRGDHATAAARIGEALDKAAEARREAAHFEKPRPARVLIGVDQAERLFTESPKDAEAFAALLQALADGVAYVIMVMRADAYARFQAFPELLALRAAGATFDLIPPTAAELDEIVARPVAACEPALAFGESDPPLGQRLVADAKGGDALPLLQMTLEGLYKAQETRGDGVLRAEDYKGMAAAVTEAADAAMAHLGAGGRGALDALVAGLVADVATDPVTAEPLPVVVPLDRDAFVKGKSDRAALIDSFVEARLLTLEGGARLRPTHDALLRIWPDAAKRVAEMAALIRARHALAPLGQAWAEAKPDEKPRHLQISAPLLAAGQQLEARFGDDLSAPLRPFIAEAEKADADRRARETRRRRLILGATLGALVVMTVLAGAAAWQWREAAAQKAAALLAKNDADAEKVIALNARNDAIAQKAAADQAKNEALAQKSAAERNLGLATDAANSLVFDIALKFRDASGVPASLIKSILQRALDLQQKLLGSGQSSPDLLRSEVAALAQTSETLLRLGDTAGALDAARKAASISETSLKQEPQNTVGQFVLAVSDEKIGDVEVAQGQLAPALDAFRAQFAILDRLAKSDPGNPVWQGSLSEANERIGDVEVAQGQLAQALDSYRAEFVILDRLAKNDPSNAVWQHALEIAYEKIGNVEVAQGRLSQALNSYQAEFAILDRLAKSDPSNADWQHSLEVAHEKIGDVEVAQGQLSQALNSYQAEFAILDRLAKSDPGNAGWQSDLAISHEKIGGVQFAEGQLAPALNSYQAEFAILDHLAKSDPGNAGCQRALAISHEKMGGVQDAEGQYAQALDSFKSSLSIMERLAKSDPSNAGWQYDLSISYGSIGALESKHGQLAEALESYRAGLAIAERLARSDLSNSGWQSLLWASYQGVGVVERMQGDLAEALESYKAGLAIIERLATSDPSNANWQSNLLLAYQFVGEIEVAQGQAAQALNEYQAALAIAERLAAMDPSNKSGQFALASCYFSVGSVYVSQSNSAKAREAFEAGRVIMANLVALSPDNADWKAGLAGFDRQLGALRP